MIVDDQSPVIAFLADPASYGGALAPVERIETHASIVFLTADRAYKLKRAVKFSYLDYSTLALRRKACDTEYRLNLRTAPELYLAVRDIRRGPDGRLAFAEKGEPVDSVVVMRRFDQASLLDNVACRGGLTRALMQALADAVAEFHRMAEVDREYGGRARLLDVIDGNAANLALASPHVFAAAAVERLTAGSQAALRRWEGMIEQRRRAGRVRLCHGDLHLRNICLIDGRPTLFDCIEFSRSLATVDVLYDLSFLLMDLIHREFPAWASFVFNRYFDRESEVEGAALLPLFMSMHAAIRAHVTVAAPEAQPGGKAFERASQEARGYLDVALSLLLTREPQILAIGGPSGTGKSSLAYAIAPDLGHRPGARVLRSDVMRKRLMGVAPETRLPPAAYTPAANRSVYAALMDEARRLAANGQSVILDAVFARREEQEAAAALGGAASVGFRGIWLNAPLAVMEARVQARSGDASDATVEVIRQQIRTLERPADWLSLDAAGSPEEILAGARKIMAEGAAEPDRPLPF